MQGAGCDCCRIMHFRVSSKVKERRRELLGGSGGGGGDCSERVFLESLKRTEELGIGRDLDVELGKR